MEITMPYNEAYEVYLLSAILGSERCAEEIFSIADSEDFYTPKHSLLYNICKDMFFSEKPMDIFLILEEIKHQGKENILSREELLYITPVALGSSDIEFYLNELKNLTSLRKIIYASKNSLIEATTPKANGEGIISKLQSSLLNISGNSKKNTHTMQSLISNFSQNMSFADHLEWMTQQRLKGNPPYDGISCGYPILDETLGFFRKSCIYYIGARTSMGKTTFILNLMERMKAHSIGFFSLEMTADVIAAKLMCIAADIKFSHYEDATLYPEKKDRLLEVAKTFNDKEIYIEDPGAITISQLRSRAKRMKSQYGIEILFIDYLTRIRGDKSNSKHLEVDSISKGLQSLAKELEIPIICLAQLNRQSAKDSKKENLAPSLVDFRESGSIEEDADACILLHRPDYYDPSNRPGIIKVIVAKNRLRGIVRTIEFQCNFKESDRYTECLPIEDQLKTINIRHSNDILDDVLR